MIVTEHYKQNETYVVDKKIEDIGAFIERVNRLENDTIKEFKAKMLNISYIKCLDNNLMCIVTYELDNVNYKKYSNVG